MRYVCAQRVDTIHIEWIESGSDSGFAVELVAGWFI
jgi:hypothetical protein